MKMLSANIVYLAINSYDECINNNDYYLGRLFSMFKAVKLYDKLKKSFNTHFVYINIYFFGYVFF